MPRTAFLNPCLPASNPAFACSKLVKGVSQQRGGCVDAGVLSADSQSEDLLQETCNS